MTEDFSKQMSYLVLLPESFDVEYYNKPWLDTSYQLEDQISTFYDSVIKEVSWTDSTEATSTMRKMFCGSKTPTELVLTKVSKEQIVELIEFSKTIKKMSRLPISQITKIEELLTVDDRRYNTYLYSEFNYTEKTLNDFMVEFINNPTASAYYYEDTVIGEEEKCE